MLIVGSQVPNLLEPGVAATLVVSKDVDVGVPVEGHAAVKRHLDGLRGLRPSPEELSVWIPDEAELLEVNFVGMDSRRDPSETNLLEDDRLPLLVFGPLALLKSAAEPVLVEGVKVPVPRPAGLALEKLVTDRTGEKGERDLLVALGVLLLAPAGSGGARRRLPDSLSGVEARDPLQPDGSLVDEGAHADAGSGSRTRPCGSAAVAPRRGRGGCGMTVRRSSESLERRLDRIRSRLVVRRWEYRQRNLSKGVWFRVRHVLAYTSRAYVIPEGEVAHLLAEGYEPVPVGRELEPEKHLFLVPAERAEAIRGAREIEVRLTATFLEARAVALVRFHV